MFAMFIWTFWRRVYSDKHLKILHDFRDMELSKRILENPKYFLHAQHLSDVNWSEHMADLE